MYEEMGETKPSFYSAFAYELIAGTAAGITSTIAGYPFDTLKVRMQTTDITRTMREELRIFYSREGIRGFFKGLASPVVGNAPITALIFAGNETGNRLLREC